MHTGDRQDLRNKRWGVITKAEITKKRQESQKKQEQTLKKNIAATQEAKQNKNQQHSSNH